MMYVYKRIVNLAVFPINPVKDVTYELDKKLILCEGLYYPEEEDVDALQKENTYVLGTELIPDEHGVFTRKVADIDGNIYNEFDLNKTWLQQAICESFCDILKTFCMYIPPVLTIRDGSRISVIKMDNNTIHCGFMLKEMMIPSKVYEDFMVFWPYMFRTDRLIHCTRCGLLYDGNAQCDCIWHYEWYEVDS